MSSARPKFIYSTIEDHVAATALLKLRYGIQEPQKPIAWRRTMRDAAIDARKKIHDQASTR
jgi:hypothetical protein